MAHFRTDPATGRLVQAETYTHVQVPRARLQDMRQQRRPAAGTTHNYSQFVRIMKFTLPLVAFSLVVLVVVYSTMGRDTQTMGIQYEKREGSDDDRQLVKPRLTGADGRGQPFTVTAQRATQAPGKSQKMNFTGVAADVTMLDKSWLALEATRGLIDVEGKTIDLYDTINIYSDKGYECHTSTARYDFGAGLLKGENQINCQGPLGLITAQGFEGVKDPGQMTFTGGVQTTIYPAPRDAEAAKAVDAGAGVVPVSDSDAPFAPAPAADGAQATSPSPAAAATPAAPLLSAPPQPKQKPTPP